MTTTARTSDETKQSPQEKPAQSKLPLGAEELKKLDALLARGELSFGGTDLPL